MTAGIVPSLMWFELMQLTIQISLSCLDGARNWCFDKSVWVRFQTFAMGTGRPGLPAQNWNGTFGFPLQLYYVLSGMILLWISTIQRAQIICMETIPRATDIRCCFSLYISRVIKLVNKSIGRKQPCYLMSFPRSTSMLDTLMATARANKVATTLAVQDYSQLKKDYGRDQAEVIMNIVGNVISGQVVGETSKLLVRAFGKIVQRARKCFRKCFGYIGESPVYPIGFRDTTSKIVSVFRGVRGNHFRRPWTKR